MRWRTQGQYRGLGQAERTWLREFDRRWDTKKHGRSRTDALERQTVSDAPLAALGADEIDAPVDVQLLDCIGKVTRFTVPKEMRHAWSIHLILNCGRRVRVKFDDHAAAFQAYLTLQELSVALTAS